MTDPAHVHMAARLRKQFRQPRIVVGERGDLVRDLCEYDRAFGLTSRRVQLMGATKNTTGTTASTEAVKQIPYLAGALKARRITEAASRLAEQARDSGWTHEDYLAAVLEREVSARNASGAQLRIRAAVKTLDDFDFGAQPAVRQQVGALASGAFLTEARNVVLLGPPGTGKPRCGGCLATQAPPWRPSSRRWLTTSGQGGSAWSSWPTSSQMS
ncbi:ATP-binding protein [Nostocoides sp.]|uniref:ATP-binding protein n=1 Tax=Nostocoides sp. TaxID=1917966 RepID=UPI003BAEE142